MTINSVQEEFLAQKAIATPEKEENKKDQHESDLYNILGSEIKDTVHDLQGCKDASTGKSEDMPYVSVTTDSFEEEIKQSLKNVTYMKKFVGISQNFVQQNKKASTTQKLPKLR